VRSEAVATHKLVVTTSKKLAPLVGEALLLAGASALEERPGRGATLVVFAERRAHLITIWQRAQELIEQVRGSAPQPRAQFETDARDDWKTSWMQYLRPVSLTPRLVLAPLSDSTEPLGRRQRRIVYEPALAFGDGDHPTTRLAARAIERHYRGRPGGALLDIGTGTGVLSFVAVLSGARRATGTDIDRKAVRAATRNARLNALTGQTRFIHSSARLAGPFDLVVVNIELRPLLQVLKALPTAARRAPRLLVTGILT
jgi:ribosomal protein L11 methyltransferase